MACKVLPIALMCSLAVPVVAHAETDDAIRTHFTENEFEARRKGTRLQMTFIEGGIIAMQTPMGTREGTWLLSGTELCIETPRGGIQCGQAQITANGGITLGNGQTLNPAN